MTDTEKQIAGLKKHLREAKQRSRELESLFFSVYCLSEGLKTQNEYFKSMGKRLNKERYESKIEQNKYLVEELEKIFAKYNENNRRK